MACRWSLASIVAAVLLQLLPMSLSLMLPLRRVPDSIVNSTGGRCLDGSPPGYYMSLPNYDIHDPLTIASWRIHFRGGGWCFTAEDCRSRSKTSLGSSLLWPAEIEDAHYGFMSTDTTVNPKFGKWGVIYIEYCDGSSYLSDVEEPVKVLSDVIYFRGQRILQAVFTDLEEKVGLLSQSKRVILSGTSAGGLATYLHCSAVHKMFNSECNFRCLPDAGLFLDHVTFDGQPKYRDNVIAGLQLWNGTYALDETCKKAFSFVNQTWKCAFAQYIVSFIPTKIFVLNSMYDRASMGLVLHLNCDPSRTGSCTAAQLQAFQSYHQAMLDALHPVLVDSTSGVFATACYQHEESCQNADWTNITIHSVSMRDAVGQWYDGESVKLTDVTWPNDHTCVLNITHGPC